MVRVRDTVRFRFSTMFRATVRVRHRLMIRDWALISARLYLKLRVRSGLYITQGYI